eukprot:4284677-Pleurochrysis_carterae.AAC.1
MIIAKAVAGRIALNPTPSRSHSDPVEPNDGFSLSRAQPAHASARSAPVFPSDQSLQIPETASSADARPTNDSTDTDDASLQEHFQRGLG